MRTPIRLGLPFLLATLLLVGPASARPRAAMPDPTFDERVVAQAAIERVAYRHVIGRSRPFEEVFTPQVLEAKVREYLEQSAALEVIWGTRVTGAMLQSELGRIVRRTRLQGRLDETFAALGNDPFLIQECFVRQVLVDRLARKFFSFDGRLHAAARTQAGIVREELVRAGSGPAARMTSQARVTFLRSPAGERRDARAVPPAPGTGSGGMTLTLPDPDFTRARSEAPARVGEPGPVEEHRTEFVIRVLRAEESESMQMDLFEIPKITWDEWWSREHQGLDWRAVRAVAEPTGAIPAVPVSREEAGPLPGECVPEDVWDNRSLDDIPLDTFGHTTVWTGDRMIVWGGRHASGRTNRGHQYDPLADTWSAISRQGAPTPRYYHTAVWTGDRMIVWGGSDDDTTVNSGGLYDPRTDTWTATTVTGAPAGRAEHTAVWTGDRMIVWGGYPMNNTGGIYDPQADEWSATSTTGAPTRRANHTAVWSGGRMIVWGGIDGGGSTNSGGLYDPLTDIWATTSLVGAPAGRAAHGAVWAGDRMIVWGGSDGGSGNTGGRYDPLSDGWSPTTAAGAPAGRAGHSAVWTGTTMIVWGGSTLDGSGGRYDPIGDSWLPMTLAGAPSGRQGHGAVWTGSRMVVWGGAAIQSTNTGGQYDPDQDAWTPTDIGDAPANRSGHSVVWTGNQMLVWGGSRSGGIRFDTGDRYDPLTDHWTPMTLAGVPAARSAHSAVWTGERMIVWGGYDGTGYTNTGGQYDPVMDAWVATTTVGAPTGRAGHTAVWAGDRMIVWGGGDPANVFSTDDGGEYDPTQDSWVATSPTGAPAARGRHAAVWTGHRMVVWGGDQRFATYLRSGGRYDPMTREWVATSTAGAPAGRAGHTAVWTGEWMIAWGGYHSDPYLDSGGRYDPSTDTWMTTTIVDAPPGREGHAAVWTGSRMIVWSGYQDNAANPGFLDSGGLYDPWSDTWLRTSIAGAPDGREGHTAAWTGGSMIVWGGIGWRTSYPNGGIYGTGVIPGDTDADSDGVTLCEGDCDDADPGRFPHAPEICDAIDNDCDGAIDEDLADSDGDGIADGCDVCPTLPNPGQDPADCRQEVIDVAIDFKGEGANHGSGLVTWRTTHELSVGGFLVVSYDALGRRAQLSPALVPCTGCTGGEGASYGTLIPKHRGGRSVYIEMIDASGAIVGRYGPAVRR